MQPVLEKTSPSVFPPFCNIDSLGPEGGSFVPGRGFPILGSESGEKRHRLAPPLQAGLSHIAPSGPQSSPSPLVGEGWGGGYLFDSADSTPPSRLARYACEPTSPTRGGNRSELLAMCNCPSFQGKVFRASR